MLPFAVNYTGFSSYGQTRYPSLKPGHTTQDQNIIYEDTKRQMDHMKFYNNFKNLMSSYKTHFVDIVDPKNYKKNQTVLQKLEKNQEKHRSHSLNLLNNLVNQDDKEQIKARADSSQKRERDLLQTGVEHWKSMYNASFQNRKEFSNISQPDWAQHKLPFQGSSKLGHSEYKTKFGRTGQGPLDIMNKNSKEIIKPDDELKQGTTLCTKHIPGYTGYIPAIKTATLAYEHGKGIETRNTIVKQNILENQFFFYILIGYFVLQRLFRIPNYQGYIPKNTTNLKGNLRPQCFSTAGETFI